MRHTIKLAAAVIATAALFAAGCGDDDNGDSGSNGGGGGAYGGGAQTTPGKAAPAGAAAISMKDVKFDPADQTVKVGEKVTWTNDDSVDHNVVAEEGADFKSDNFGEGGTYDYTPEAAGTIKYTCTLHPGMDGTLTVQD